MSDDDGDDDDDGDEEESIHHRLDIGTVFLLPHFRFSFAGRASFIYF